MGKTVQKTAPIGQRLMGRALKGFTLLEMMVVIAIMGIMTAIALPRVSDAVRKARSQADAKKFKSVLTYARYFARSSLRCTMVQVQRNTAADKDVGWEAKIWSYDSCDPPARKYPLMGGRAPFDGEKLEKMVSFNASLVDFPDSDKTDIFDHKHDTGKDVVFLFDRDGALAKKYEGDTTVKAQTFRVRCIHEYYGRFYKYVVYPITGSIRLCLPVDTDSICN